MPKDIQILGDLITLDITHETSIDNEQLNSTPGESDNAQGEAQNFYGERLKGKIIRKNLINLSRRELTDDAIYLLSKN